MIDFLMKIIKSFFYNIIYWYDLQIIKDINRII